MHIIDKCIKINHFAIHSNYKRFIAFFTNILYCIVNMAKTLTNEVIGYNYETNPACGR